jgi:hypothetical protein
MIDAVTYYTIVGSLCFALGMLLVMARDKLCLKLFFFCLLMIPLWPIGLFQSVILEVDRELRKKEFK